MSVLSSAALYCNRNLWDRRDEKGEISNVTSMTSWTPTWQQLCHGRAAQLSCLALRLLLACGIVASYANHWCQFTLFTLQLGWKPQQSDGNCNYKTPWQYIMNNTHECYPFNFIELNLLTIENKYMYQL